jgi:hypothetical protein
MARVIWMPRGQASTQLNTVRQRQTPLASAMISSRSSWAWSRESVMKRCAFTMAAGPTYEASDQKTGQEVVQAAQRMQRLVSS